MKAFLSIFGLKAIIQRADYCQKCDTNQTFGDYCVRCGTKLQPSVHCQSCNEKIWGYYKFCPKCGKEVS